MPELRSPSRPRRRALHAAVVLLLGVTAAGVVAASGTSDSAEASGSSLAGESFTGSSVADSRWLALGPACLTAADTARTGTSLGACSQTQDSPPLGSSTAGNGYLQLTDDSGSQSGSVLYNRALPSSAGVDVKFDTYQYGPHTGGADGIGFYLTDGSYTLSAAGPSGGSLGYTYRSDAGAGGTGVAHGFLGVGLDVYGNNSNLPTYQGTTDTNGSPCPTTSRAQTPQSVVVRGPGNGSLGYCVLSTVPVASLQNGATLDSAVSGQSVAQLIAASKRNVEIIVSPTTQAQPDPVVTTLIDFTGTGTNYTTVSQVQTTAPAPPTVKLGFSASTGGSMETHLLRSVSVSTVQAVGAVSLAAQVDHTATTKTTFTAGDTVPFAFTVSATGANPLTGIQLTDPDVSNITCPSTTLAVADSMTCTGTRVLTASDVQGSPYTTTAQVTADDGSGTPAQATASATVPTYRAGLAASMSASPTSVTAPGQTVTLTLTATNTGTVPLTGVTAALSSLDGATTGLPALTCAASSLAPGVSTPCTGTYTTTQADFERGTVDASGSASGAHNGSPVASGTATVTVTAVSAPALAITGSASPTSVTAAGQAVSYAFPVTNTGNRVLSSIGVTADTFSGTGATPVISCPVTVLSPGAGTTCTATYTTTQDDVDAGSVSLTAHAAGTTSSGAGTTSARTTIALTAAQGPALGLTAASTPQTVTAAGQQVTFTWTLTNPGNVTLHGAQIATDSFTGAGTLGTPVCTPTTVPVGGTAACTAAYTTVQPDVEAGGVTLQAHATATGGGGAVTSPTRAAAVAATQAPALTTSVAAVPAAFSAAGATVAWTITVTNSGNLALHGLALPATTTSAGALAPAVCAATALAPGASTTCTVSLTSAQADLDAGAVTARVQATATTGAGASVAAPAAALTDPAVRAPALAITATAVPGVVTAPGQQAQFQYAVTDTGNTTIAQVAVLQRGFTGSGTLPDAACPAGPLAPGASVVCTAAHTVTDTDMADTGFGVTVTATGDDRGTVVTSAAAAAQVAVHLAPALALQQTFGSAKLPKVGGVVQLRELVTNTGDAPLTGIAVSLQAFTGSGSAPTPVCPATTLAPGASMTCTADHAVTQADLDAGSVGATALATGSAYGRPVVSTPSSAAAVDASTPAIQVVVTSDAGRVVQAGQRITFRFLVTNIGRVTALRPEVSGIAFTGVGALTAVHCPAQASLAPQQSMVCTAEYVVQGADAGRALSLTARAGAVGAKDAHVVAPTATDVLHVPAAPAPAALAFTGAGALGWGAVGSAVLAALLAAGLLVAAARRRTR